MHEAKIEFIIEQARRVDPPKRNDKRIVATEIPEEMYWALRKQSMESSQTINSLIYDALNLLFETRRKPTFQIQRQPRGRPRKHQIFTGGPT